MIRRGSAHRKGRPPKLCKPSWSATVESLSRRSFSAPDWALETMAELDVLYWKRIIRMMLIVPMRGASVIGPFRPVRSVLSQKKIQARFSGSIFGARCDRRDLRDPRDPLAKTFTATMPPIRSPVRRQFEKDPRIFRIKRMFFDVSLTGRRPWSSWTLLNGN